jgi:sugar/nucleoside kinase (ribokinase family)
MSTRRKILVFGPAYLDRVIRVDSPLIDPALGGVIDRSVQARADFDSLHWQMRDLTQDRVDPLVLEGGEPRHFDDIIIYGLNEGKIEIELPPDCPGPAAVFRADERMERKEEKLPVRRVRAEAWHDDLGGMGAGFAKAFGGELIWIAGAVHDVTSQAVNAMLDRAGINHRPIHVPDRFGEWTLLITSGEHGDKLAVGVRNLQETDVSFEPMRNEPCDLLVAASMTNKRAASALKGSNARVRMFAPSRRNMIAPDTRQGEPRVGQFARHIDILCCNRGEWETLADREEVAWRLSVLAVTDGPHGAEIRYTTPTGDAGRLEVPAFPRQHPPRDTNRAGEAFASTLVTAMLDAGWIPGTTEDALIQHAAERASAAAGLVLDRVDFGFPTSTEIDRAIAAGVV